MRNNDDKINKVTIIKIEQRENIEKSSACYKCLRQTYDPLKSYAILL